MNRQHLKSFIQRIRCLYYSKTFLWSLVGIGIILHLSQYIFNRSLWPDEAFLALDILDSSYAELLQPLKSNQTAPIGFLLIERFLYQVFGNSEYVLRFFPFLCGILSIVLFTKVAPYFIEPAAIPIALSLFAASYHVIYYATCLKQYSSDMFFALLSYAATMYILSKPITMRRMLGFGILGSVVLWFSHPSVFILAGIGISSLLAWLKKREWEKIRAFAIAYSLWFLNFAFLFVISLYKLIGNEFNQQSSAASGGFMPFLPTSFFEAIWPVKIFFDVVYNALGVANTNAPFMTLPQLRSILASVLGISPSIGLPLSELIDLLLSRLTWTFYHLVAAFMIVAGYFSIRAKDKMKAGFLVLPALFMLIASRLHTYPLFFRLMLFLVPVLFMLLGEGAMWIQKRHFVIGIFLIVALSIHPLSRAGFHLFHPRVHEEARPVVRYLRDHKQPDDIVYVYYMTVAVYRYYSKRFDLENEPFIGGVMSREDRSKYIQDLEQLRGNKRVWLVFSHAYSEETFFINYLDTIGKRLDSYKSVRASVYLYDLS